MDKRVSSPKIRGLREFILHFSWWKNERIDEIISTRTTTETETEKLPKSTKKVTSKKKNERMNESSSSKTTICYHFNLYSHKTNVYALRCFLLLFLLAIGREHSKVINEKFHQVTTAVVVHASRIIVLLDYSSR